MDYKDYEAEDLLLDRSFCNYCLGRDPEAVFFWEEWILAHPERYEVVRQARELYSLLNGSHGPSQYMRDEQAFLSSVKEHLEREYFGKEWLESRSPESGYLQKQTPEKEPMESIGFGQASFPGSDTTRRDGRSLIRKIWLYAGAAAAAVILAIGIHILRGGRQVDGPAAIPREYLQSSGTGERKSFTLNDGTKLMLNAGSTLKIAREFNVSRREIWLEGEGFFDVAHDAGRPFVIHTSSMDVKVLGTVLNVRDYPKDKITETSLLKGSVAVTIKGNENKEIVLHPNEKIVVSNERSTVTSLLPSRAPVAGAEKNIKIAGLTYNAADSSLAEVSWTQNVLSFNETNFEEIAIQLERWYSVSIHFGDEAVKQFKFTGTFQKKTLPQVLDALQLSRHFEYEIKEDSLVVIRAHND
ncbi:MAG: DUF4974 domain-containing protein [Puia sp.]|nr:DUF4974 domain-containing protein [Puia sp.]